MTKRLAIEFMHIPSINFKSKISEDFVKHISIAVFIKDNEHLSIFTAPTEK